MLMDTNEWDDIEYLLLFADTSNSDLCNEAGGSTRRVNALFGGIKSQELEI